MSEREKDAVLELVKPSLDGAPSAHPRRLVLGGIPGTAKSTLQEQLAATLGVVSYEMDLIPTLAPGYAREMRRDPYRAGAFFGEQMQPVVERALDYVTARNCDLVTSRPMCEPRPTKNLLDRLKGGGRRGWVGVAYIAVHPSVAKRDNVWRRQKRIETTGYAGLTPPKLQDQLAAQLADTIHACEVNAWADSLFILSRDFKILYENHRGPDGTMGPRFGARAAYNAERNRPFRAAEITLAAERFSYLAERIPQGDLYVREALNDAFREFRGHHLATSGQALPHRLDTPARERNFAEYLRQGVPWRRGASGSRLSTLSTGRRPRQAR